MNEAAFAPARRSKNIFGVRSTRPERLLTSRRIHEGMDWGAAAKTRSAARNLATTDRDNCVPREDRTEGTRHNIEATASPAVAQDAASPRDFQGMTPVSNGVERRRPPATLGHQGPDAPLAHRRSGYPSSGCVPAEPASVSPDTYSLLCTGTIRGENHREIRCAGDTPTKKSPAGP